MFRITSAKTLLPSSTRCNFKSVASFHTSRVALEPRWKDLSVEKKQNFTRSFVALFKEKNPCSKSNVMYKELTADMEEHGDTPYVFGILYNELTDVSLGKSTDNEKGEGLMGDDAFLKLLYKD
ncbi:hypothetical protein QEN19_003328 [Hanseniaspora menglaensis]